MTLTFDSRPLNSFSIVVLVITQNLTNFHQDVLQIMDLAEWDGTTCKHQLCRGIRNISK